MTDTPFLTWAFKSFSAATATRTLQKRLEEQRVNGKDFAGVVGDGVNDDTAGIQAAIDYALNNRIFTVYLPEGEYKVSNTLHLGYGWVGNSQGLNNVRLVGAGGMYALSTTTPYKTCTVIGSTFKDRPIINIAGGRGCEIRDIAIYGPTAITDPATLTGAQRADSANYIPSGATDYRDTPFCGICIDGYTGTQPANPYPVPPYPSWARNGGSSGYGAAASSDIILDRVYVAFTNIGVMIQPNRTGDGQGEFLKITNCKLDYLKVAIGVGNTQARQNDLQNLYCYGVHTMMDGATYGTQAGNIAGNWSIMTAMASYQVLKASDGWTYPTAITNLYLEACMRLGQVDGLRSNFAWRNCHFFCYDDGFSGSTLAAFYREPFFDGNATFDGCTFYGHTIYHFPQQTRFVDCAFDYLSPTVVHGTTYSASLRACLNAFGQVFMGSPTDIDPEPDPFLKCRLKLNGRGHTQQEWDSSPYSGFDKYEGVCMWGVGVGSPNSPNSMPFRYDLAPAFNLAQGGGEISMSSETFTNDSFTFNPGGQRFYQAGDVIRAKGGSGMWWYVESQDVGSPYIVRCRALTYIAWDGSAYTNLATASTYTWHVYYPIGVLDIDPGALTSPVFMTTTAGSPTVTFVNDAGTPVTRPSIITITSKPLWCGRNTTAQSVPFPALTTISNANPTSTTITMSANAQVTGTWAFAPGIKRIK